MSGPLLSVGIPFFNAEDCLLEAVRSIFAQTYSNWELILVDDGSSDASVQIARSIDDPRVRLLPVDGENRRLAARLNQIAREAQGYYLARMDADDLSHPERFARQLKFLKDHPEVDVIGTSSCILDGQGQPVRVKLVVRTHQEMFRNKFKGQISIVHPSLIAKTQWWRRWPYDVTKLRGQDYELWLRSRKSSVFANIPDMLYFTNEFRSFSLGEYAKNKTTAAEVIWRYARSEVGSLRASYHAARRYLHIGIYVLAIVLGRQGKLISRRYGELSAEERREARAGLEIIKDTEVPLVNATM